MLNEESLQAVQKSVFSQRFVKPLYDSFCFSRLPHTVSYLLTQEEKDRALPMSCYEEGQYETVIFLFLDAFGWCFFEKFASHPFLRRCLEEGRVSKLTAQFPSTTACHVTTAHTGLSVGESGIYEWFQYEPIVDRIIAPLPFSYAGGSIEEALLREDCEAIFPFTTLYQRLHAKGVSSYVFQPSGIAGEPYSQRLTMGAHPFTYFTLGQGLKNLKELVERKKGEKTYAFFYFPDIDATGHRKGVQGRAFMEEVLSCLTLLEEELASVLERKGVALLVSADHGMVKVRPRKTFYLNRECPDSLCWMKKNRRGMPLIPAGSCRDFFLHVDRVQEVQTSLQTLLDGRAEVWKVQDLIEKGFFGNAQERLKERVGNLVILPYEEEGVWWFERRRFEQNFHAAHGGLTREEMEIPLLFLGASM